MDAIDPGLRFFWTKAAVNPESETGNLKLRQDRYSTS